MNNIWFMIVMVHLCILMRNTSQTDSERILSEVLVLVWMLIGFVIIWKEQKREK